MKHSAATSSSASPLGSSNMDVANSGDPMMMRSEDPLTPPSKRCFNSEWSEGPVWLKHDCDNDVMSVSGAFASMEMSIGTSL